MILVRLMGGIGNQMFQYAFGKCLAFKNKTTLKLDLTLLEDRNTSNPYAVFRNFELDKFDFPYTMATKEEIYRFNPVPQENIVNRVINKLKSVLVSSKTIIQEGHDFNPAYLEITDDRCVVGRWQSESFFEEIRETIRNEFQFRDKLDASNEFYHMIASAGGESVAIHIRRGDYVSNKFYAEGIGALDPSYYLEAVAYLKNKSENLCFFIFSDDIAWCKENMQIDRAVYVQQEKKFNKPEYDLQLISKCRHHIISNSTFSWWGAWLSEDQGSIVIAPKTWARKEEFGSPDIIPERWTKMDNKFEPIR